MQEKNTTLFRLKGLLAMGKEEDLEREIDELKAELKDREDSLPAHSVRPEQMLVIEDLEAVIEDKEKELNKLRKRSRDPK
ncbi:MAG: hypothetical protein JSW12_18945 [Deltaproteobacteria bacterium]|nr:MAG: hypothetical protein JSW12_18945 [Deltaproteobacteria bacterium]